MNKLPSLISGTAVTVALFLALVLVLAGISIQQRGVAATTLWSAPASQGVATNIRAGFAQQRELAAATHAAPAAQAQQQFPAARTQQGASAKPALANDAEAERRAGVGAVASEAQTRQQAGAESRAVKKYRVAPAAEAKLSRVQIDALLRRKIKYVFVLYQENRSFDSYFGTFPGADGIFSHAAKDTPGFYQPLTNIDGSAG
ncbi:MAG: alkaline phosphatase family protein, partial [Candidatus Acidiferrales bacterium]